MSRLNSDLVRDSKLDTAFVGGATLHVFLVSEPALRQRRRQVKEKWVREERLGAGSYGSVWLESCTDGRKKGELRAVKEISKLSSGASADFIDYGRELEAIAKFSNEKVQFLFICILASLIQGLLPRQVLRRKTFDSTFIASCRVMAGLRVRMLSILPWSTSSMVTYKNTSSPPFQSWRSESLSPN